MRLPRSIVLALLALAACTSPSPRGHFELSPETPQHRAAQIRFFETRDVLADRGVVGDVEDRGHRAAASPGDRLDRLHRADGVKVVHRHGRGRVRPAAPRRRRRARGVDAGAGVRRRLRRRAAGGDGGRDHAGARRRALKAAPRRLEALGRGPEPSPPRSGEGRFGRPSPRRPACSTDPFQGRGRAPPAPPAARSAATASPIAAATRSLPRPLKWQQSSR